MKIRVEVFDVSSRVKSTIFEVGAETPHLKVDCTNSKCKVGGWLISGDLTISDVIRCPGHEVKGRSCTRMLRRLS